MIVEVFDGAMTFVTDGVGHVEMGPCCSGVSLCCCCCCCCCCWWYCSVVGCIAVGGC